MGKRESRAPPLLRNNGGSNAKRAKAQLGQPGQGSMGRHAVAYELIFLGNVPNMPR